jgi:hypothetical protein
MTTNAKTYFIRHSASWDIGSDFRTWLWSNRSIAIKFDDERSINPAHYTSPSAQRAIKTFVELARDGGYVCAVIAPHEGCLVAKVSPGTPITFKDVPYVNDSSKLGVVKIISIPNAKKIPAAKANRLLIGQPQQGTLAEWKIVGDRVRQFFDHGDIKITKLGDLLPFEQEVMCSEFLRLPAAQLEGLPRMAHLSALVGRNRKALDVTGVSLDGTPILAQVTHLEDNSKKIAEKEEALRDVGRGSKTHLIMFCRSKTATLKDGVRFFPLEQVFEAMKLLPAWRSAIGIST